MTKAEWKIVRYELLMLKYRLKRAGVPLAVRKPLTGETRRRLRARLVDKPA